MASGFASACVRHAGGALHACIAPHPRITASALERIGGAACLAPGTATPASWASSSPPPTASAFACPCTCTRPGGGALHACIAPHPRTTAGATSAYALDRIGGTATATPASWSSSFACAFTRPGGGAIHALVAPHALTTATSTSSSTASAYACACIAPHDLDGVGGAARSHLHYCSSSARAEDCAPPTPDVMGAFTRLGERSVRAAAPAAVSQSWSLGQRKAGSTLHSTGAASAMFIQQRCMSSGPTLPSGLRRYNHGMITDVREGKWEPNEYVRQNPPFENVQLLGEQTRQDILTELTKHLFASMPLLIEKMKAQGFCFHKPITTDDLMIDEFGQFVIRDGTVLEAVSYQGISRSYKSAAILIESIILQYVDEDHAPADTMHLLSEMKKKKTPHSHLMLVHPSFIPLPSHSQAYLDVHHFLNANFSLDDLSKLLKCPEDTVNDLEEIIKNNSLLRKLFKYKPNRPFHLKTPESLFKRLRNLECHILEWQKVLGKYTSNQIRILVRSKFSTVLSALYWMIWGKQLLVEIETESYFCKPGVACCRIGFCLRKKIRLSIRPKKVSGIAKGK